MTRVPITRSIPMQTPATTAVGLVCPSCVIIYLVVGVEVGVKIGEVVDLVASVVVDSVVGVVVGVVAGCSEDSVDC